MSFPARTFLAAVGLGLLLSSCTHKPGDRPTFVVIHSFTENIAEKEFAAGLSRAADSLGVAVAVVNQQHEYDKKYLDSLYRQASGYAGAAPLLPTHADYIYKAERKKLPLVLFHQKGGSITAPFIDAGAYTAGRTAARFLVEQFGKTERYGIFTLSLENKLSNECIRGFRDELRNLGARWRQVNIITCQDNTAPAIAQYGHASRFGNRIIWLFAGDCENVLPEIGNLKKGNFFLAIDLHSLENNIMLLKENTFDALVIKDYRRMGQLCLVELVQQMTAGQVVQPKAINCGNRVLTAATFNE